MLTVAVQACNHLAMAKLPSSSASAHGADEAAYGLDQLLDLAGERLGEEITPRTVRLYATEGLIDRPGKDGRRAVYGRRHLLQLLLIRSLARRGLSLSAIAPHVASSDQELEQQLQQLLDGSVAPMAISTPTTNDALEYLQSLQSPASAPSQRDISPSLLPLLGSSLSSRSPSLRASRMASRSSASSSRWHRFSLAPGVELHLSESASIPPPGTRREAWLRRLIDRLREQLDQTD
jgi:DNA-binding transcriptional MerR regulator